MFKRFKKLAAFTLAELLLVFAIIGIVSAITIMTTKRLNTVDKFAYQRAYDSLLTAAYNAVAEVDSQGIGTSDLLCKGLAKYINSQAATETDSDHPKFSGDTDSGFCNKVQTRATKTTDNFNDIVPDFIANNGMRFYITDRIKEEGQKDYAGDEQEGGIDFYIVYVDLDGSNGQNSIGSGDVVAFAVTDNADVIPLGWPAYDKHYLGVRVIFPENSTHQDEYYSDSMTYYEAIHTAWGDLHNFDDLRTLDFNDFNVLQDAKFMTIITEAEKPNKPSQHTSCICDTDEDENCADNCVCDKTADENCDSACAVDPMDRFECDIKIQRYY